jgi:hypothetical protein
LFLAGFGSRKASSAQTSEDRSSGTAFPLSVTLNKSAQKAGAIATAPLAHVLRTRQIQAYGTVLSLQGLANLGKSYAQAGAKVENAKTRRHVSQVEYARQKALYAHNQSSSLKDLQLAESRKNRDQVDLSTARTERRVLTATALQQWGKVIAGWVFSTAPTYSKLIDQEHLLIQVTLPAAETMPRMITIQAVGRSRWKADFVSPAPRTDPQIQGLSYFYTISTPTRELRAGMNVAAFLPVGSRIGGFVVPGSAVVWQNGQPLVFVQTGREHFTARTVATNLPISGGYLVTKGFSPDERLVVAGAQTLLSEALLSRTAGGGGGDDD